MIYELDELRKVAAFLRDIQEVAPGAWIHRTNLESVIVALTEREALVEELVAEVDKSRFPGREGEYFMMIPNKLSILDKALAIARVCSK